MGERPDRLKRACDLLLAGSFAAVLLPLGLLIAAAIKLDSRGPTVHVARRVGLDGQPFRLYKFRSMHPADRVRGPAVTAASDSRVTRVGRFLRWTKLDEMPQLINVILGQMSLVGPRPEDPRFVALYTPEQRRVLSVRPGIASPAAVQYRNEEELLARAGGDVEAYYVHVVLPDKLRMDLEYIDRWSVGLDALVLCRAVAAILWPPRRRTGRW